MLRRLDAHASPSTSVVSYTSGATRAVLMYRSASVSVTSAGCRPSTRSPSWSSYTSRNIRAGARLLTNLPWNWPAVR
jgi:hypothetical protein